MLPYLRCPEVEECRFHSSGSICSVNGHTPIKSVELETENHPESGIPIGSKTKIIGVDGAEYNLKSRLISPTSFVRFAREFPGGTTELFEGMAVHTCEELGISGTGLVEWLFTHPEKRE